MDAHEIVPGLWQGSAPIQGTALAEKGFGAVVLCAMEHQPTEDKFPGLKVIHAPNADDFSRLPSRSELEIAVSAANQVARLVDEGQKVLVTCWQGRNRSGLVSALALHNLTGQSGFACILRVRAKRRKSLSNPGFQEVLSKIKRIELKE